jgi:hypothetical protein
MSGLPEMAGVLVIVYVLALLAALTKVAHHLWPRLDLRAGVTIQGIVPDHSSLGLAAVLSVAYAGAVALLYERSRLAWWYCLALAIVVGVIQGRDVTNWILDAGLIVILLLPRVRSEVKG